MDAIQTLVASTEVASSMGARVDPVATGSFVAIAGSFALLRFKVASAMTAKEARLEQELLLQKIKISATTGEGG